MKVCRMEFEFCWGGKPVVLKVGGKDEKQMFRAEPETQEVKAERRRRSKNGSPRLRSLTRTDAGSSTATSRRRTS